MRFLSALAITSVAFSNLSFAAVPEAEEEDDWSEFETSVGDDDEEAGASRPVEDSSLAEAADADLTEPEREMRMALCIGIARQKFHDNADMFKQTIETMMEIHKVEENQAAEMVHITMIKHCYINFDQENDIKLLTEATTKDGVTSESWNAVADRVISPPANEVPGTQSTLAARQWDLIRAFVEKERTKRDSEKKDSGSSSTKSESGSGKKKESGRSLPKLEVIGSQMGAFQKFLYFVAVFGAIFGGGYLLVKKLIQNEVDKESRKNRASKKKN